MAGSDHTPDTSRQMRPRGDAAARKARALPLIVAGATYAEVAEAIGASVRSIRRWMTEDAEFRAAVEAAQAESAAKVREAVDASADATIADALERRRFWTSMMRDPEYEPKDRLKASELLAKAGGDFVERREISGPDGGPMQTVQVMLTPEAALECAEEGSKR